MPNYTYTSAGDGCDSCEIPFSRFEAFNSERLRFCPDCGSLVRIVIRNQAQVQIKAKHRAGFQDYREDLARFPGDKQAFVNSPEQTDRLVEKRKREGWRVRDEDWGDMANTLPKGSLSEAPEISAKEDAALIEKSLEKALKENKS